MPVEMRLLPNMALVIKSLLFVRSKCISKQRRSLNSSQTWLNWASIYALSNYRLQNLWVSLFVMTHIIRRSKITIWLIIHHLWLLKWRHNIVGKLPHLLSNIELVNILILLILYIVVLRGNHVLVLHLRVKCVLILLIILILVLE